MDEAKGQGPNEPRRRILTSTSKQQLEGKVLELVIRGWERVGDVAVAKSVIDSEPAYFSQVMVQVRDKRKIEDDD